MSEAIKEVNMVVEGVYAAKSAKKLAAKYNVKMPIIDTVNMVLFEGKNARDAVNELMVAYRCVSTILCISTLPKKYINACQ